MGDVDVSRMSTEQLRAYVARLEAMRSPASLGRWLDPTYRICAHTRLIGDELSKLKDPDGPKRLMILAPPRSGKSHLVTQLLPLWWLMHFPNNNVVAASYGADLAAKWGRSVRRMVQEWGPRIGLEMSTDVRSAKEWRLASGGGMKTVGVGSGITGHDADLLLCDDPIKDRAEAESQSVRDSVDDWWSSTFTSRQSPGTPICLILTPWHEDDIAGRLKDRERDLWRIIRLPAYADSTDDPLGRVEGEPLPHPKIPADDRDGLIAFWESRRRESSVRDWHALYMCDPQPLEGTLISEAHVEASIVPPGTELPGQVRVAVAVDPSGGGKDEAGIVAGFAGEDGRCYITADRSKRLSSVEWAREVAILAYETAADVIFVETNFGGDMAENQILSGWASAEEEGIIPDGFMIPRIERVRAKYGKRIRAEPVAQRWVQGHVRLVGDLPKLVKEWTTWQQGSRESPGRIDATTYLVQGLIGNTIVEKPGVVEPPIGESIYALPPADEQWETLNLW